MATYRVVFRYLCHLVWEKKLIRLPDHCKGWIDIGNEEVCMYPSSMQGLSNWEIENCPWWLDLGEGYVLAREMELYKVYSRKDVVAQFKRTTTTKNDVEQEKVDSSPPKDQVDQTSTFQGGDALSWLEKYIHVLGLEVVRRVTLYDKLPCGYEKKYDTIVSIQTSLLVFARRTRCCPSMFLEESSSHFHKLQIDPLSDLWVHFFPKRNRLTKPSFSTTWRGGLQRSPMFLLCALELLCPPSGLVLEMGCETAPLMRASSRPCSSFDIDETIVNDVVLPLVQELNSKRTCLDEEESLELDAYQVQVVGNPYDDDL
ncbi:hypothetical protein L7F22_037581 [Adiantum nelumboides]|nr:hypothetical protein [Adiantum nelumboides]